jgi:hypothetical protein
MKKHEKTLGVIAGQGALPRLIVQGARDIYKDVYVLAFEGDTDPDMLNGLEHHWLKPEEIARSLEMFKQAGVQDIVMAGRLSRPSLKRLKPPILSARIVARLGKALFAGDDTLFRAVTRIFEEEGFHVVGANDVLAELTAPEGLLTHTAPNAAVLDDIDRGFHAIRELGKLDIGQAVIVKNGQILGVEALEGTDALIARCATLGDPDEPGGVLIKARKPGQEERVDLPAMGVDTVRNLHAAGFAGIALEANGCLIIEKQQTVDLANGHGLFIQGFSYE